MTPTAQVLISILPLVAVVLLSLLFFFYMLWEYKKSRLIIEKGGTPPEFRFNEKILLIGIISLFVGAGLFLFFLIYNGLSLSLLGGIIPTMTGLGIITYNLTIYRLTKGSRGTKG